MVGLQPSSEKDLEQRLLPQEFQPSRGEFLPLMMKIYNNGKMTAALKAANFRNIDVKVSIPRGRGLELDTTPPGRIIIVAGGTGLFPFSDIIDLLFKAQCIEDNHSMSK